MRHGQYDSAAPCDHPLQGELTPIGKQQAKRAAKALMGYPITAIHYSTLRRTEQTAQPIIEAFPEAKVSRARRLWECIPYVAPEYAELFARYTPEQLAADASHAEAAFAHYFKPTRGQDKHEVIVAHGNLIRYFVVRALGVNPAAWFNMATYNCGLSQIRVYEGHLCELVNYNEIGHLPANLRTDNMHTSD